jgi:hypothetical protein
MISFQQYLDEFMASEGQSPAQRRAKRLASMNRHLKKTMAKYRAASDAGIHPSKVNQRRNKLTIKKGG